MSEYIQPANPEEYDDQYDRHMSVFSLAETLEDFAAAYSEEYAENSIDGVTVHKSETDLGGLLYTSVTFEAQRARGSFDSHLGVPDNVINTEFVIKSVVRQDGIPSATLPQSVVNYLAQFEDFVGLDPEENPEVALEYEQSYFVSDEGEFMYENSLTIYVDGEGVSLPEYLNDLEAMDDEGDAPEDADDILHETHEMIASVFSEDEILAIHALSQQIIEQHELEHPVYKFYEQMDEQRHFSRDLRLDCAERIVRQMFTEAN